MLINDLFLALFFLTGLVGVSVLVGAMSAEARHLRSGPQRGIAHSVALIVLIPMYALVIRAMLVMLFDHQEMFRSWLLDLPSTHTELDAEIGMLCLSAVFGNIINAVAFIKGGKWLDAKLPRLDNRATA